MKNAIVFLLAAILALTPLTACQNSADAISNPPQAAAENQPQKIDSSEPGTSDEPKNLGPDESQPSDGPKDLQHTIGEGVNVNYTVTSEDAALKITGCPSYGDKRTPYVYGELTNGDPFAFELITIIIVGGSYYGKKPYNDAPNGLIKPDGTFALQFSSNDGVGTDWNAENILLFLVPSGYKDEIKPDTSAGYVIPPSQVSALKENSVCVIQIDREIPVS